MKAFIVYDTHGYILRTGVCLDADLGRQRGDSEFIAEGVADDATEFIDVQSGKVTSKQDFTLEQLPLPCTVTIEGTEYPVTEQPVFEFDAPGQYLIQVDAGPRYLKKEFTLDYQP